MKKWNDRNFLSNEFWLITIIAAITWVLLIFVFNLYDKIITFLSNNFITTFYATIAAVFGALLGFSITSISILLPLTQGARFKKLRASSHYKTVFKIQYSTILFLGLTTLTSIIGILTNSDVQTFNVSLFALSTWLCLLSLNRIIRAVWILRWIVKIQIEQ